MMDLQDSIEFIEKIWPNNCVTANVVEGINCVLHQAAIPSLQRSIKDPVGTNRANVTATVNFLESCRKAGILRVVYAASSPAYGDQEVLSKSEEMSPNPLSSHALQKLVGEHYDLYGLETVSLRYFNVFGPDQDAHSEYSAVISKFITKPLEKEPLTAYRDGEQSRDFTYIDNVVEANLLALRAIEVSGNVCNIGCGEHITLNKLMSPSGNGRKSLAFRRSLQG
jgi:nucleoside-diphosphate-sugar epimerase